MLSLEHSRLSGGRAPPGRSGRDMRSMLTVTVAPDTVSSMSPAHRTERNGSVSAAPNLPSVVMFVLNPVTRDRRVLKEAASLARAGISVTIIGINLAKEPRPSREELQDGVTILRIPLSMAPDWWRPSTRYFIRLGDLARRRRMLVRHRLRRWWSAAQLGYERRRHRAGRWLSARRGTGMRLGLDPQHARRRIMVWRRHPQSARRRAMSHAALRLRRLRHRAAVRSARWRRLSTAFTLRQAARVRRFATQPSARRWAWHRARRRAAARVAALRPAIARWLRSVKAGLLFILCLPLQLVFTAWATVYLLLNQVTRGELDWALNTRRRWAQFASSAARAAPEAAVYHAHDFSALAAAVAARERHGGLVVYDSHELYVEAGSIGSRSPILKWAMREVERRMYRTVDHLISVNRLIAQELHRRYGPKATTLIHNCPPRWNPPAVAPDHLRQATGIPSDAPIALYQGGFSAVRGLRQMAEAITLSGLESVHLVFMGFGPMESELRAMRLDKRFGGRVWVVPAVEPDELDSWVASADVSLMTNQPTTLNEIVSTPNKLFESIAAGVPVVTSDFPERRRIILDDPAGPLGAVCDATDARSIARAIQEVLDRSPEEAQVLRRRCLEAAHRRWNWETEEHRLLSLYADLTGSAVFGMVRTVS